VGRSPYVLNLLWQFPGLAVSDVAEDTAYILLSVWSGVFRFNSPPALIAGRDNIICFLLQFLPTNAGSFWCLSSENCRLDYLKSILLLPVMIEKWRSITAQDYNK